MWSWLVSWRGDRTRLTFTAQSCDNDRQAFELFFPPTDAGDCEAIRETQTEASHERRPHQYALVDVPVADRLHADPDDTRVGDLFVVDRQRGRRRAAGRGRGLRVQNQGGGAEVWV